MGADVRPGPVPAARRLGWVAAGLAALALARSLLWMASLPPWYGPDEPTHYTYVEAIAIRGVPPVQAAHHSLTGPVTCSAYNLGFRTDSPFVAAPIFVPGAIRCPPPAFTAADRDDLRYNDAGNYTPLYYLWELPLYELGRELGIEARVEVMRLGSALLGAIAVIAVFLGALHLTGDRRPAIASAVLLAAQPTVAQQTSVITNDAALVAAGGLVFWALGRAMRKGLSWPSTLALGLALGACALAKPQGALAAIGPLALLALPTPALAGRGQRIRLMLALGVMAAVLAAGYAAFIAWHGPGSLVSPLPPDPHPVAGFLRILAQDGFHRVYWTLVATVWGEFSWLNVTLPWPVYATMALLMLAAALGVGLAIFRPGRTSRRELVALSLLVIGVVLGTWSVDAFTYRTYGTLVVLGRSFLPAFPAAAFLMVSGLLRLLPARAVGLGSGLITAGSLGLCALALAQVVFAFLV